MTWPMLWPASVPSECPPNYWHTPAPSAKCEPEQAAVAPIAAAKPMITWLQSAAEQTTTQAEAHRQAMASTPGMAVITENHITQAILATINFFGINMAPIAFTEAGDFICMRTQTALAMNSYQAETLLNTAFQKLEPMAAILNPSSYSPPSALTSQVNQFTQMISGFSAALPSTQVLQQTVGQVAELARPMQQVKSLFTSIDSTGVYTSAQRGDTESAHRIGLFGASTLSSHPLVGITGTTTDTRLLCAESLPSASGSLAWTPLMTQFQLIDKSIAPEPRQRVMLPPWAAGSPGHNAQDGGTT
ncbi:PPE-family protein [Mycobacterium leprae Kyoto-2]|uniref:PPE-family protein n=3 Tax=Mycobacterium leprae TaxID=1769 RepID=Q7AQP1_MYCLE|nr:PPE domain-containing protein [Mycobacterium leprae]CAR70144.1 PPE-family protein [Mycobacterium leprae Br4923]AWV47059.1 PPE family protein [Mycobacterium leprae]CAA75201.1 hypothetical protein [Mycobacterium leprae]CAC29559.1 PPE-family protein [Mycobacterium leprae]BBC16326.1 PPE-family protein [Mycobacterium leprae Kyoto-2]